MKNVINWFEIYVSDFDRAKRFYSEVFKVELTDLPMENPNHPDMKYATFPSDMNSFGASGALAKMADMKPGMGGTMVYFSTPEITDELSRVESAGGKIFRGKTGIGENGFIALVEDTEGNLIGMHSMK